MLQPLKKISILISLLLSFGKSHSQTPFKIDLLNEIPSTGYHQWCDSIEHTIHKADEIALRHYYKTHKIEAIESAKTAAQFAQIKMNQRFDWDEHIDRANLLIDLVNQKIKAHDNEAIGAFSYLLGEEFLKFNNVPKAIEYMLASENVQKHACSYSNKRIKWTLAKTYFDFNENERALEFINEALDCEDDNYRLTINLLNAKALIETQQNLTNASLGHFGEALEIAVQHNDSAWIGILSGNIGNIYYKDGKLLDALPLLQRDYDLSSKYQQWNSAINALIPIIDIELKRSNPSIQKADSLMEVAKRLSSIHINQSTNRLVSRAEAKLEAIKGNYKRAYELSIESNTLQDTIIAQRDKSALRKAEIKAETERHLAEIEVIERERHQERMFRNTIIALAVLTIIILFLFYRLTITKKQEEQKRLEIQKENAESQLANSKELLGKYIQSIRDKNAIIEQFQTEIQELNQDQQSSTEKENWLNQLYQASILTEDDWMEFKRIFERAHPGFFNKLQNYRSDLTTAEIRFLALLKLGLEINEMAAMLGISPNSVRRTRLRLKTKLDLNDISELIDFLNKVH